MVCCGIFFVRLLRKSLKNIAFPLLLLTCSNATAHSFLIFTQHSEERDTSTPTWYSVWYLSCT